MWSHTGRVEPKQVQRGTVVSSGRAWLATKVTTTALTIKEGNRSRQKHMMSQRPDHFIGRCLQRAPMTRPLLTLLRELQ